MSFHDSWRKFRDEPALLREIDEEELDHVADFLRDMKEDDLPFPHLFGSKMRVLIPFEKKLLAPKLQKLENFMVYKPNQPGSWEINFDTGMMRREIWSSPSDQRALRRGEKLVWMPVPLNKSFEKADKAHRAKLEKEGWKFKTQQMKIGKWLTKYKRMKEKVHSLNYPTTGGIDYDAVKTADGELYDFAGSHFASRVGHEAAQEMLDTWGHSGGKSKPLAIVLSRHPIDILRMADYEHIQSCHSPRSRGAGEYYHCAVADAHGHGAIAYLVNEEQLGEFVEGPLGGGEFSEWDDEEIFADRARDIDGIEPLARVRVRRFVYSKEGKEEEKQWTGEVAIPEDRIYGPDVSGFLEEVKNWLRQNQEEAIKNLPDDLSKTGLIGGTYFDTAPMQMFFMFLPKRNFKSAPQIIADVEEEIMGRIGADIVNQWNEEIQRIETAYKHATYRRGKRIVKIEAEAYDDGGGQYYIQLTEASMVFTYPLAEFNILPHNAYASIENLPEHFDDMGVDLFSGENAWIRKKETSDEFAFKEVAIELGLSSENLISYERGFSVEGYLIDPDEYQQLLLKINEELVRDHPGYSEEIKVYLQREGIMKGGAIFNLARDAEDGEFDRLDWEVATDDGWSPGHVNAKLTKLKVPPIPEARFSEFKTRLREEIVDAALKTGSEYLEYAKKGGVSYPNSWVTDLGYQTVARQENLPSGEFEFEFEVTDDTPDDVINTLTAIILEIDHNTVQAIALRVAEEVLSDSEKDAWGRRRRNLDEQIIDNWRTFLND